MLNSLETLINNAVVTLNNSSIIIGGKKFVINLEEFIERETITLSSILDFKPVKDDKVKKINPYTYNSTNFRLYKNLFYHLGAYYIFLNNDTKEKKDYAIDLMKGFFDIEDKKEFTAGVTEFKNLQKCTTKGKYISKHAEDIFNTYFCFNESVILKILQFSLYHPYEFNIDVDIDEVDENVFLF